MLWRLVRSQLSYVISETELDTPHAGEDCFKNFLMFFQEMKCFLQQPFIVWASAASALAFTLP